jgi:hypothetical protein
MVALTDEQKKTVGAEHERLRAAHMKETAAWNKAAADGKMSEEQLEEKLAAIDEKYDELYGKNNQQISRGTMNA